MFFSTTCKRFQFDKYIVVSLRRTGVNRVFDSGPSRPITSALALVFLIVTSSGMLVVSSARAAPKIAAPSSIGIPVTYTDVTKAAGLKFKQDGTATDQKYYLETMGTGVAWLDYDQDGLMDLFFVQSASTDIYKPAHPLRCALYHNNGDGTVTDVTDEAGVAREEHSR